MTSVPVLRVFFYRGEGGGGVMPDDLKERLEAGVAFVCIAVGPNAPRA